MNAFGGSDPRNPYRDTRHKSFSFRRTSQTTQQRFLVLFFTLIALCFVFFSTSMLSSSSSRSASPPIEGQQLQAAPVPRLKGAQAAREASMPLNFKVMTFNLRFAGTGDGYNSWVYRKDHLIELINRYHPAVMGTQEGLKDQLAEIHAKLEHPYERFGIEREVNGEFEQIFYDTTVVEKLDGGNFWLSESPDTPGTIGWDAACVRLVTWCKFRLLKTQQEFFFFNTQLDHVGAQSRAHGSRLLWDRIKQITGSEQAPLFLVGDFNTYRRTETYRYMVSKEGMNLHEAWPESKEQIGSVSFTYHGWAGVENDGEVGATPAENHIDWILYRPQMTVSKTEVITEKRNGRYPSDHYPIQAEFLFPTTIEP